MTDDRLERIGRLAALARGLEREGGYNGAKLVRALLDQALLRYADATAPEGGVMIGQAVEALARASEAGDPQLAASLAAVGSAARAGSTVALAQAPPVRTCRACGQLFLGEPPPAVCPTCGSPALAFKEQLPVWYLEPSDREVILAALADGPRRLDAAIQGRDDAQMDRPPAPGAWSVREGLEHLLFAEELFAERVDRLLTEDDPDLAARAVWSQTPVSDEGSLRTGEPASILLDRYRALRRHTLETLLRLDPSGWARSGHHAEWGRVSVLTQAAYFARHEASHQAQVVAAADGRVPRPRS